MGRRLVLRIPESVTTRFLVGVSERTDVGAEILGEQIEGEGLAGVARDLLSSGALVVSGMAAHESGLEERLKNLGGPAEDLERLGKAAHHFVVTSVAAPEDQPRHAQAARLVTRALAARTSGLVADLASNQLLPYTGGPVAEPERFVLGEEWTGAFVSKDEELSVRVDTAGLHRFGMPELAARGIPLATMLIAINTIRGLAHTLLDDHRDWIRNNPGERAREVDPIQSVASGDVLRFWGARPAGSGRLPVRLIPVPAACAECDTALEVQPPDPDAERRHWWYNIASAVIPALTHAPAAL